MDTQIQTPKIVEEDLREAACDGDRDRVRNLLQKGVQIDSQNSMNGWWVLNLIIIFTGCVKQNERLHRLPKYLLGPRLI
jgi:hypothetical protein